MNLNSLGLGDTVAGLLSESLTSIPLLKELHLADNNLTDKGLVPILQKLPDCR